MSETIGSNLLGRNPSPKDERDYRLSNFINLGDLEAGTVDPYELIVLGEKELKLTTVSFKKWASTSYNDVTQTHWWKALNYFTQAKESLGFIPATTVTEWQNPEPVLDQGNTGHCVGFSGAQWGNTLPVNDQFDNQDGHNLYYECKILEGEPNEENGAYVRSIAEVLKNKQRLSVYAFANSVDEAIAWLQAKGPVIFGTSWLTNMFYPDAEGLISATGSFEGGHAYLSNGYDSSRNQFLFINSWSSDWGKDGHFKMSKSDIEKLFADYGEILAAVELPL